ncbi:MAG: hypothetical protein EXS42_04085 [Lacunisphaera sp.]|nr:hypothetical protein [Lacunisphaera sp.]
MLAQNSSLKGEIPTPLAHQDFATLQTRRVSWRPADVTPFVAMRVDVRGLVIYFTGTLFILHGTRP